MTQTTDLSSQDLQTRQHIYETAITLFREQGYDKTTIADIVASADVTIEMMGRYFARKEDIVMMLYSDHVTELVEYMKTQPAGQLANRYNAVLEQMLRNLTPDRLTMMALFGRAMQPDSNLSLMGTDNNPLSRQLSEGYRQLVLDSDDALREPKAMQLGITLYTFHMMIVLFWLYDRSPDQQATHKLRRFVYELFKMLRPMFMLPMIPQAIAKLSQIMMPPSDTSSDV